VAVVVVAAPPSEVASVRALLTDHELGAEVQVVAGGSSRSESVRLALASLAPGVDIVLVHDAARPLAPEELADSVAAALRGSAEAVVPVVTVTEPIVQIDHSGRLLETLDRSHLRVAQTPQGFRRATLEEAYRLAGESSSDARSIADDAALVARLGRTVCTVAGSEDAFLVTRPIDLLLAEAVLARRRANGVR
jgi:2-C-methyl-D-erythritol 4-phosphate cytidylyltransferase